MRRWLTVLCVVCLPLAVPATAMAARHLVQVQHAWMRPAMAGKTGMVYLSITSHDGSDRLTGVRSPAAAKAELVRMYNVDGVLRARAVRSVPVRSGRTLTLRPGGFAIALVHMKHKLTAGDRVPVTLHFARAGNNAAMAMVERSAAREMRHVDRGTAAGR